MGQHPIALDKADGKELWKWTAGLTRMHFSPGGRMAGSLGRKGVYYRSATCHDCH